jgi:glycosyltransferase involved in cell wall biosynthesis
VLEAMAMEKPVIVSSKGLEGIHAVHGEHILLADSAQEYIACLQQLRVAIHPRMGHMARQQISRHFNWDENLPEVVYLLAGQQFPPPGEVASA